MRIYVESYGCTLNTGEARQIETKLQEKGHDVVRDAESAEANILVTCTVIESTERRMIARMKTLAQYDARLIISGCMATAQKGLVKSVVPNAELFSPGDIERIVSALNLMGNREVIASGIHGLIESSEAIIPISQGCQGRCSYCITRLARGGLRSQSIAKVLQEVNNHVARGCKEIRLTAQDSTSYGLDIGSSLPDLIDEVSELQGDFKVRIGMANPRTCTPILGRLIESYRSPKVYKFLHLPVQSGSNEILEAMSRDYKVDEFKAIVEAFRAAIPDITVSTDLIVGFPGETDELFNASLSLVEDTKPDIVNVTRFSPRPGTPAASMPNQIVDWRKKIRSRRLSTLRFSIASELNRRYLGKTLEVSTIEKGKPGTTLSRSSNYKQVVLEGNLPLGRKYFVEVTGASEIDLRADVVDTL